MAGPGAHVSDRDAVVWQSARAGDRDRYLAGLLAPRRARPDLMTLTAFLAEVARITSAVREPMMGEIRLQWWRDALADGAAVTGNPVADALAGTIARNALSRRMLVSILDAYECELAPGALAGEEALARYLDATDGAAFRLAAHILDPGRAGDSEPLLAAAGQAWGRVRLLRALSIWLASGRNPLTQSGDNDEWAALARSTCGAARSWLKEARLRAHDAPRSARPAVLPLALVEPYLAALERLGPDIARQRADISPLTRVWRLWLASALRRV